MTLFVNTNMASLINQSHLGRNTEDIERSINRLSSGLRINTAEDDPTGLAISDNMRSATLSLQQAVRNSNDGISVVQTAESALGETTRLLQRLRSLAIQASSNAASDTDRGLLQQEVVEIKNQIDAIATNTRFNDINLLDGTYTNRAFQTGIKAGQNISLSLDSSSSSNLNHYSLTGATTTDSQGPGSISTGTSGGSAMSNTIAAQTLTIAGSLSSTIVSVAANSTAFTVASAINSLTGVTGVSAEAETTSTLHSFSSDGMITLTLGSGGATTVISSVISTTDVSALGDAINDTTGTHGISASVSGGQLILTQADGKDIRIQNVNNNNANATVQFSGSNASSAVTLTTSAGQNDTATASGVITFKAAETFTVASTVANSAGGILDTTAGNALTAGTTALSTMDISTISGATNSLDVIDSSIAKINDMRGSLGAYQNRLSSSIPSLESQVQSLTIARSRIIDADFAKESAEYARANVLQQTGAAMLTQANQLSRIALTLLGA